MAEYLNYLSQALWNFQQKGHLCDVILHVDGHSIQAHKVILAAGSTYFQEMLNKLEPKECAINIDNIDHSTLTDILQYLYTGTMDINEDNVNTLCLAAELLQISNARKICDLFLKTSGQSFGRIQCDSEKTGDVQEENASDKQLDNPNGMHDSSVISQNRGRKRNHIETQSIKNKHTNNTKEKNSTESMPCEICEKLISEESLQEHSSTCKASKQGNDTTAKPKKIQCQVCLRYFLPQNIKSHKKCKKPRNKRILRSELKSLEGKVPHFAIKDDKTNIVSEDTPEDCKEIVDNSKQIDASLSQKESISDSSISKTGENAISREGSTDNIEKENSDNIKVKKKQGRTSGSTGKGPYHCDQDNCDMVAKDRRVLRHHKYMVHGIKDDNCTIHKCPEPGCKYETLRKHHLLNHSQTHSNARLFECKECGKKCKSKYILQKHIQVLHSTKVPTECKECMQMFDSEWSYKRHYWEKHQEHKKVKPSKARKKYTCDDCSYICDNQLRLDEHKASVHKTPLPNFRKGYYCQYCDYVTLHKNRYEDHVNRHTGANPFVCEFCGTSYSDKTTLNWHLKTHTGRSLQCPHDDCSYTSGEMKHLKQHLHNVHLPPEESRKFLCHLCGYRAKIRGNLTLHLRNTHKVNIPARSNKLLKFKPDGTVRSPKQKKKTGKKIDDTNGSEVQNVTYTGTQQSEVEGKPPESEVPMRLGATEPVQSGGIIAAASQLAGVVDSPVPHSIMAGHMPVNHGPAVTVSQAAQNIPGLVSADFVHHQQSYQMPADFSHHLQSRIPLSEQHPSSSSLILNAEQIVSHSGTQTQNIQVTIPHSLQASTSQHIQSSTPQAISSSSHPVLPSPSPQPLLSVSSQSPSSHSGVMLKHPSVSTATPRLPAPSVSVSPSNLPPSLQPLSVPFSQAGFSLLELKRDGLRSPHLNQLAPLNVEREDLLRVQLGSDAHYQDTSTWPYTTQLIMLDGDHNPNEVSSQENKQEYQ